MIYCDNSELISRTTTLRNNWDRKCTKLNTTNTQDLRGGLTGRKGIDDRFVEMDSAVAYDKGELVLHEVVYQVGDVLKLMISRFYLCG